MITASNLFNSNMMAKSRIVDSYIVVNGTTTYDSNKIVSWEFHDTVSLSDVFEIGTAVSNTFNITLQNITPSTVDGATIEPFMGVNVGGSSYQYVSLGKFIVSDMQNDAIVNRWTLTCYDRMGLLDIDYTWTAGDTDTIANVMSRISTLSGVPLAGTYPTTTINKVLGFSCRDMLGFMAGLMAGWGVINRSGSIAVKVPRSTDSNINNTVVIPAITFDTNIANYVKGNTYTMTVNSASRSAWDAGGVKVGDYICNGGSLGLNGVGLGTITGINGYVVTMRCETTLTDSSPATWQDTIGRRTTPDIYISDDNWFEYQSAGSDLYSVDQIEGTDYNGNVYTNGTLGNFMVLRVKNPFITQAYVDSIAAVLKGRVYNGYTMDWQGNPAMEAGDNIRFDRSTDNYPWTMVVTDTVYQYPDFSAFSQNITESKAMNAIPPDDTGDVINGGDIINSNIYGGIIILTNNGGVTGGNFGKGLFGIHAKNQDIRGLNALIFNDAVDASSEGIFFLKSTGATDSLLLADYDRLWAVDGSLYLGSNSVIHEGQVIIQTGTVSVPGVANGVSTVAVTFPQAFPSIPSIQVTPNTGGPETFVKGVSFSNPTVSGFNCNVYRVDTTATTIYWAAIWGRSR
ncbi:hypothetical protein HPK19_07450 [Arthrobacter citreus]|nr:hypothetical protein HPK19_07450 [Arthrobacter citreus]